MAVNNGHIHPHRLAGAPWLTRAQTQTVLGALESQGHAARIVGGTVRNALIGRPVTDIDIATTATPEQTVAAARAAGLKSIPTGIAHGTVTVMADHVAHEVTTLRRDIATDGRRATIAFTSDWREDALRRDFTINALFCNGDGTVFDFTGGMADLDARRVRFIGDAQQRIREDFLRILRFFRFSAELSEGRIDADGLAACDQERAGLAQLSAERVRAELMKLLAADGAIPAIDRMLAHGHLVSLLGAAPAPFVLGRLIQICDAIDQPCPSILRLAALASHVREDADRIGMRLRLSNAEIGVIAHANPRWPTTGTVVVPAEAKRMLYRLGADAYRAATLLSWARSDASPQASDWLQRLTLPQRWSVPEFPLNGRDLIAAGVAPGPSLGSLLGGLEVWWIESGFAAEREQLLVEARRRINLG